MASLLPLAGTLGLQRAKHLLNRATFGPTKAEIELYAAMTADQALGALLTVPSTPPPPIDPETNATWVINGPEDGVNTAEWRLRNYLIGWWLQEAFDLPAPSLVHKMTFFLHTCFTTNMIDLPSEQNYYTLLLLRHYALGSYQDLAHKISVDNAMMRYLDTRYSHRWNPNENFARELLELFTIGKGPQIGPENYTTYTEDDIRAAAKVLTGFRLNEDYWDASKFDPDTGLPSCNFDLNSHDPNDKTFTDAFVSTSYPSPVTIVGRNTEAGMIDELGDLINMIFSQKATALNIVRKIYRFFVYFEIPTEIETDIIDPLADQLIANNYQLGPVMETLLKSEHFYDLSLPVSDDAIGGAKIKNPVELMVGAIRFFQVQIPDPSADLETFYRRWHRDTLQNFFFEESGLPLMDPPNVAGYPAHHQEPDYHRLWISANTLPFRYTFPQMLLSGTKVTEWGSLYMQLDPVALVTDPDIVPDVTGPDPYDGVVATYAGGRFASHLVSAIVEYCFPHPLPPDRFNYFLNDLLLDNLSPINWRFEWLGFETTGDDSSIRPRLEALIKGIMESPEYQLC
ncbi:MAG: DUF1800 family protein [Bacteroidota bacterium]